MLSPEATVEGGDQPHETAAVGEVLDLEGMPRGIDVADARLRLRALSSAIQPGVGTGR
jgi:hypothetical protein